MNKKHISRLNVIFFGLAWLPASIAVAQDEPRAQTALPANVPGGSPTTKAPPQASVQSPKDRMAEQSARERALQEKIFTDFAAWTEKYLQFTAPAGEAEEAALKPPEAATVEPALKLALEQEGVALATERRQALKQLIIANPQRALDFAMARSVRGLLPQAVTGQLEELISARGEFLVLAVSQIDPVTGALKSRLRRDVIIAGKAYHAYVYGRRLGVTTKRKMALHGIAVDNYLAVQESPVRLLEPGERPVPAAPVGNPDKRCPICGQDAAQGVLADVGGTILYFDTGAHLKAFTNKMREQENIVDPQLSGLEGEKINLPH